MTRRSFLQLVFTCLELVKHEAFALSPENVLLMQLMSRALTELTTSALLLLHDEHRRICIRAVGCQALAAVMLPLKEAEELKVMQLGFKNLISARLDAMMLSRLEECKRLVFSPEGLKTFKA